MKFIKDYWFCMLMFIALVAIVAVHLVRISKYDKKIQERDDKIEMVTSWNDSLHGELDILLDENDSLRNQIPVYADSINDLIKERTLMKRKHEKQMFDIISVPVDSKYSEVTNWLDSR